MHKNRSWMLPALILGIFLVPASSFALDRSDVELPDISSAFNPVYHLDLRTTHTSSGALSGVAVTLDRSGYVTTISEIYTTVGSDHGRQDARSHKRTKKSKRRAPPRPKPRPRTRTYYSSTLWLPIAVVVAVAIVITIPVMMVVYY